MLLVKGTTNTRWYSILFKGESGRKNAIFLSVVKMECCPSGVEFKGRNYCIMDNIIKVNLPLINTLFFFLTSAIQSDP